MHDRRPNAHAEAAEPHAGQNLGQTFHILCLDFCMVFGTNSGQKSISAAWIFGPYLAPVRRKMFICFCTVAAAHQDIRPKLLILLSIMQSLHALSFGWRVICARKARKCTNKITPALHTNICRELFFFLCVIMLGNKSHETSWNYTFLGYSPNFFFGGLGGGLISVKKAKHQIITQKYFGNIAVTLRKSVWIFAWGNHTKTHWNLGLIACAVKYFSVVESIN